MEINKDDIQRYRDGSLSGPEKNALEKKALNDPFLADALEGAESVTPDEFAKDVAFLSKRIKKADEVSWFTPLRVAAGIVLTIGIGALFFLINEPPAELLASKEAVVADSIFAAKDSTTANLLALEKEAKDALDEAALRQSNTNQQKAAAQENDAASNRANKTDNAPAIADLSKPENQESQPAAAEPIISAGREAEDDTNEQIAELQVQEEKLKDEAPKAKKSATSGAGAQLKRGEDLARSRTSLGEDKTVSSRFAQQHIIGRVTSAEDGAPLPGVNVLIKGTTEGTVTDDQGNYSIPSQGGNTTLEFSFIGMRPVETSVANNSKNDVVMTPDATQLSEIVVSGLSVQNSSTNVAAEPVVKLAFPKGGMRAYNKYLEKNLRYPAAAIENKVKGKVTIGFTVTTAGILTGFHVIKGLGHGCDEELIRLVKEGPTWSPSTRDDVPVESEVKVRLKFDAEKAGK